MIDQGEAAMARVCYDPNNLMALCIRHHTEIHQSMGKDTKENIQERKAKKRIAFLRRNDPNFKEGKQYKEDEIGKTLKAKGFKDLINEKNGNFDVNKMNEDQYNQLRLLNNLHNIANSIKQDSDSEISVTSSISYSG